MAHISSFVCFSCCCHILLSVKVSESIKHWLKMRRPTHLKTLACVQKQELQTTPEHLRMQTMVGTQEHVLKQQGSLDTCQIKTQNMTQHTNQQTDSDKYGIASVQQMDNAYYTHNILRC